MGESTVIEFRLEVLPGVVESEAVEHVGQAVVLKVEGSNGFAQTGLESMQVVLCPGLKLAQAMVALGSDEGDPDTNDVAEGQRALPAVSRGEVAIEEFGHVQAL
jgi:hypothetical protein